MFDFFPEPWGHLVYSEEEYIQNLRYANCPAEMIQDFRSGLNRKGRGYFMKLFTIFTDKKLQIFEKKALYEWSGITKPEHLKHNNFESLQKFYSKEDLLFRGMNILLKKI